MIWIAQPDDRMSLNGRPALLVRERNEAGAAEEPVCAVFMSRVMSTGLMPAQAYAKMIAEAPRMARLVAELFRFGCSVAPHRRSDEIIQAMAIHTEITDERDTYATSRGDESGDNKVRDKKAAA